MEADYALSKTLRNAAIRGGEVTSWVNRYLVGQRLAWQQQPQNRTHCATQNPPLRTIDRRSRMQM
jgi:hypothetical protein